MKLCEYYEIDDKKKIEKIVVKLYEIKKIENMSYMFYKCKNLISIPDISK